MVIHKYSHVVQNIFFYDSMCLPIIFSAGGLILTLIGSTITSGSK